MTLQLADTTDTPADSPGAVAAARPRIRVVLADDHPVIRRSARRLIDDQPDMRVVGDACIAEQALGCLEEGDDVVVVDHDLGGHGGGLWVTRRLKRLPIPPRVLIYSASSDPVRALAARVAGADGLLSQRALGKELCAAIRRLAAGERDLPGVPTALADAMRSRVLPEHEAVFEMLVADVPSSLIEHRLALSRDELEDRRGMILGALTVAAQSGFTVDCEQGSHVQNVCVLRL